MTNVDIINVDAEVFESRWPLLDGYFWASRGHQLLRGPFATVEAAEDDVKRIGVQLIRVIWDAQQRA